MRHSKKLAALAIAAGVAITASAAFAYWTSNGVGSGSASVGSAADVTIDPVTVTGTLVPGGDDATVDFTINNGSDTNLNVGQVVVDETTFDNGLEGVPAGCSADDFTFASAATSYDVPANGDVGGSGTLSMADTSENQDDCQGASLTLHVKALQGS
jgi:hypothetical protein